MRGASRKRGKKAFSHELKSQTDVCHNWRPSYICSSAGVGGPLCVCVGGRVNTIQQLVLRCVFMCEFYCVYFRIFTSVWLVCMLLIVCMHSRSSVCLVLFVCA